MMPPSPRRGRSWFGVALVGLAIFACARPGLPPGGPRDTAAPEVLEISPEDLAAGVSRNAPITILFSEKIDRATLEKALWITPSQTGKPKLSYSGAEVTIQTGNGFPDSTTVGILLTSVIKDKKREGGQQNTLVKPHRWIFSTGDALWPGVLRGKVERVGAAVKGRGQLLVAIYPSFSDSFDAPGDPMAITEADSAGTYLLNGLRVSPDTMWVLSMFDRDGNREIRGQGEFVTAEPQAVVLTGDAPEKVIPLRLVSPMEPGSVQGSLSHGGDDTVQVWIEAYDAEADSTVKTTRRGRAADDGTFLITGLKPGRYRLVAFCDLNGDGKQDPDEPVVDHGWVQIHPGRKLDLGVWTSPGCVP